ncbi:uncharacterized protein LOC131929938 [Physella acuta]|uniref:uncharacterized protein LOC131929938 n=1 Tax=Physella acuta TaxID=109671 RepID=UPI0027DD5725|nr:uncharacterized protein LOC131929938 [Physella acuta]
MTTVIRPKNYVTIVIDYTKIDLIRLDNLKLPDTIKWREVTGMKNWKVGSTSVTEGTHTLHSTLLVYFGCYLYGMFDFYGYMHPGGYISGNINEACEETMKTMARGDLLDNDCDRRIDEEMMDGKDNDGDTLVDEDLAKPNRVDGGWGEWSQWACSNDCNVRSQYRIR